MMAIFPGFLFRKCYFRGEFTKQFNQAKDVDKLLWNVFFSGFGILSTLLLVYAVRNLTGLNILESLNYENINKIVVPITANKLPDKLVVEKTYIDFLSIISLVYFFSAFFGLMCHWIVRVFRLDVRYPLFRFKNYWYYYIHGGRILYHTAGNRKHEFTIADVLCDYGGETHLYKGILSQYTINKDDNNLENIFLTEARALKRIKDNLGNTIDVKERKIPGAAFCIPYKNVVNINLVYVYKSDKPKAFDQFFIYMLNISFIIIFTSATILLFFDLSFYGIMGFWKKTWYFILSGIGLSNVRLLLLQIIRKKISIFDWISPLAISITSALWLLYVMEKLPLWPAFIFSVFSICIIGLTGSTKKAIKSENNSN